MRAEAVSNRGPFAYQPNALPLGQTGSHTYIGPWLPTYRGTWLPTYTATYRGTWLPTYTATYRGPWLPTYTAT